MSNVAIAYPNRLLELNTLHQCDWVNNAILPLSNIRTPVLSETARTTDFAGTPANPVNKHVSFGLSLKNLPYRTFGAVGLINHNLSTSAKVRYTVFNEPPIAYVTTTVPYRVDTKVTVAVGGNASLSIPTIAVGTKLKMFACSSLASDTDSGEWMQVTVTNVSGYTFMCTADGVNSGGSTNGYSLWYVGYAANQTGKTESKIVNVPAWQSVWKRIYSSGSSYLTWRSLNLWRGCIEEEQRLSFTKISISFLKDAISGEQPTGTHLHIDINDATETIGIDNYIELGRVFIGQYSQPIINPEYGSIEHGFIDNSEITTSNSGTEFYYEKAKSRTVNVQWNHLTEDESFGGIYEASRSQGITREVLYAYDVTDTGSYQYARSFIGRFTQLNAITQPNFGQYGASINLKEIL